MYRIARTAPKAHVPATPMRRGVRSFSVTQVVAGLGFRLAENWVRRDGHALEAEPLSWLERRVGGTELLGVRFFAGRRFEEFSRSRGHCFPESANLARGILDDFSQLDGPMCSSRNVDPRIIDVFECTSNYRLDLCSEWCGVFRPLGPLFAAMLAGVLERVDFPLSPGDRHLDLTGAVLELRGPGGGEHSLWIREAANGGSKLRHAGDYSLCSPPGYAGPCIRTIHPLAHGYANTILRPESQLDGSFALNSSGETFGEPGIYGILRSRDDREWVRRVESVAQCSHVYVDPTGTVRADHELRLWGKPLLRLHYRIDPEPEAA